MSLPGGDETIYAFRRNVVVAASAGTGKTYRLTALYVLLTLGLTSRGQRDAHTRAAALKPERIVATTFSRAAAKEIAHRVEDALRTLADWDGTTDTPLSGILRARHAALGMAVDAAALRDQAATALARLHAARIDTLHGVARDILEAHPLAVGLSGPAAIIDEEASNALGEDAVDEALGAALLGGGDEAEAARDLVTACGGLAFARRDVLRLIDRLDEEGLAPSDLALADHARRIRERWAELKALSARAATGASGALRHAAARVTKALEGVREPEQLTGDAADALVELWTTRAPAAANRTPADADMLAFRRSIGTSSDSHALRARKLAALLRVGPELGAREGRVLSVIGAIRTGVLAARRRRRALAFGDLLRLARDTLRDHPDVARAVRSSFDVLLVDEFQDTSRVQRDLVYLLRERDDAARERPAGQAPCADALLDHGLFIVGDRKQSIYGFRGADVSVFASVCADLAGEAAGASLGLPRASWSERPSAEFVALRESRRSGDGVLAFVNAFASRDFAEGRAADEAPRDFEVAYAEAEHLHAAPDRADAKGGEVVLIADDGRCPDDAEPLVREAVRAAREALIAAAYVDRAVRTAAPLRGPSSTEPQRSASWRDIAILARRRSTIPLIELALARRGVPYVVAGRALYDAAEIRDLAATLRLLLDPRDRLALATVLRGPAVALSDAALAALSVPGRGLVVPLVDRPDDRADLGGAARLDRDERARLVAFRARFQSLRRAALRMPPADAIRACVEALDADRVLAALPRAGARLGNLDRLIAIARAQGGTLPSFVRWLERRIREQTDEAEAAVFSPEDDAVRVTTIHASKGLDFPTVVLVDLDAEPNAQSPGLTLGRSEEGAATFLMRHFAWHPTSGATAALQPTELVAVPTAAFAEAYAERRARERAERQRLTYVAMTRARTSLVLVGVPGAGRNGSAWRCLAGMTRGPELAELGVRTESAVELLTQRPPIGEGTRAPNERAPTSARRLPVLCEAHVVNVATTPLALFGQCPRRFRLRMLLGLEEPVASGQLDLFQTEANADAEHEAVEAEEEIDPRAIGRAAHRVLQRWPASLWGAAADEAEIISRLEAEGLAADNTETVRVARAVGRFVAGPYARSLRERGAVLRREQPFVVTCAARERGPALGLRGAIDLLAIAPDGAVDVIDYKRSRPRPTAEPFAFQLRAYALAARRLAPGRPVRAGVVYLGTDAPVWLAGGGPDGAVADDEHASFEAELTDLAARFAAARARDRWDGVALPACRAQRCGFVPVCHG